MAKWDSYAINSQETRPSDKWDSYAINPNKYGQQRKSVFPSIPPEQQVKHPYLTATAKTAQDVLTIPAHFANQFFLDYPRRVTEHFGYEYPSETSNIAAGAAAKIAGVAGGLKNPIFRAIGGVGAGLGKNILAAAATGLAYSPSKFESPGQIAMEQAQKAALSAVLPIAGRAVTKIAPAIKGAGEYVFSKGAGLSRTTLNTFNRLGYGKIRDIASKGINYIQEDVIPRARQNLLKNITMAGDASKELLQDMGFNPDQIRDVMKIAPENMKKYGNLISQNWVKTDENITNALRKVGKQIGDVYSKAAKEGQRINIRNTMSTLRKQLKNAGMMDDSGNLLGDYKTHPSTSIRNLAQLYADYAPRIGRGDISVADFMNFRTRLEASITKVVENEKFNVPIYITRKALKEDSINSLMMKGSPYEKFWRGINKEYSDLETIDYLSKKINSVVNNLPEKIMTQRNKLTDKHLRLYGRDIVNDIDAYNAAKELYPEKETLGLFNFQKPLVRTALKTTGVVREAARPVTAPLRQAARNVGQFGTSRLKQYMESPMISPATQRMIQGKKGQISFGGNIPRNKSGQAFIGEGKQPTAAEAVKQGMGAEEYIDSIVGKGKNEVLYHKIGTKNIEIIKNPTSSDIRQMTSEFKVEFPQGRGEPAIRTTYDNLGNKYIFRSDKSTHGDVEPFLRDKFGIDLSQDYDFPRKKLLSEYEAAKGVQGQNPLRNKSGQAFIGGGQENTPQFKNWFGTSKVVDDSGKPLVVYSGHGNSAMYGSKYSPKKGTAGGFYATEDPKVASNYALGKFGNMEMNEGGKEYAFRDANGNYTKKLSKITLTDEQLSKLEKFKKLSNEYGDNEPIAEMDRWIEQSKKYDKQALKMSYTGGSKNLQNIHDFYENQGYTIRNWAEDRSKPGIERFRNSSFDDLLDYIGFDWTSHWQPRPGVMPVYLNIKNPLDANKPFPKDLLQVLKNVAAREQTKEYQKSAHWTKEYSMKEWVKSIEEGNEYWSTQIPEKAIPIMKRFGYDGVKELGAKGNNLTREQRQINWIAFDPVQIKSSIGNKGTFDPKNKNITMGILGPTMTTGIGLAAALKATAARGETGESLDPKYKQQIANAENYGKTEGDWAQLEDIALRDLKRIGKLKQNVTLEQVRKDPQLYDKVAKLYWDRLDAFGIPEKDKALWWLMPARYKQTGGDISRLKNPEHRNIMQNRVKNIGGRK